MPFQDLRKNRDNPTTSSTAVGGVGTLTAFIDQGSEFEGKLSFKDTVRIDGTFRGEITSENTLIVGESGMIEANIRSNTVVISGTVEGDIIAERQVVLHKSAKVKGDMTAPSLVIEEGAIFNGQLSMGGQPSGGASLKSIQGGGSQGSRSAGQSGDSTSSK